MTKIMLVEDDKSLREIYGVRLLAEGYDIVSAGDGEEALAVAIKERPVLIITDVMMPKISGFDMLDILRSTTETRNIKVIMMTALSSDEHRQRGEQMGADRYLVKSQVGIEDVVRVVHEVLGDAPAASPAPQAQFATQPAPRPTTPTPVATPPIAAQPRPAALPPQQQPAAPRPAAYAQPQPVQQPQQFRPQPTPATIPAMQQPHSTMPPISSTSPAAPSTRQRVIQPINDPTAQVDINALLDRENAKELSGPAIAAPAPTAAQERADIQSQLASYNAAASQQPQQAPTSNTPGISIDPQGRVQPQPPTEPRAPGQIQAPPRPPQ